MRVRSLILLIVAMPLLLVNLTLILLEFRHGEKQIQNSLNDSLQEMAAFRAMTLGNYFATAMDPAILQAEFIKANKHVDAARLFAQMERPLRRFPQLSGMGVAYDKFQHTPTTPLYAPFIWIDEEGNCHKTMLSQEKNIDYTTAEWFKAVKDTDKGYWSLPYMEPDLHNQPVVTFATPMVKEGEFLGVVFLDMQLRHIRAQLRKMDLNNAGIGLVSTTGNIIIAPSCSVQVGSKVSSEMMQFTQTQLRQQLHAFAGKLPGPLPKTPLTLYDPVSDENTWFGHARIEHTDWLLVLIVPESLALQSLREGMNTRLWALGIGTLLLFLIIYCLISRNISRPLEQLTLATNAMSAGSLDLRIPHMSGSLELQELGQAFNNMGARLEKHIAQHLAESSARHAAEAASEAKSEFLARMSHEIRTPMNAIMGMAHLCMLTVLSPKQQNYVTKIQTAASNLLRIINDILDFSKIEAGKMEIECTPYRLSSLLNDLSALITVKAGEKDLEVLFRVAPGIPDHLKGDPLRLSQILLNLTTNALKFTEHGEIIVGVKTATPQELPPDVSVPFGQPGQVTLHFSVQDTGIGLTQQQIEKLFTSFSQADDYTTRKYGGTGLGLAISKRLAEIMGGTIWVESTMGVGSTFHCVLPVALGEQVHECHSLQNLQGKRALVVDDSEAAREVFREMLEPMGLAVTEAASGEDAVLAVEQAKATGTAYCLILMDWQMPGMDGIEATKAIRTTLGAQDATPIFFMSCYSLAEQEHAATEHLFQARLHKPVTPSMLTEAMGQTFSTLLEDIAENAPATDENCLEQPQYPHLQGARILLVEDNETNQEIAMALLEDMGAKVSVANDGIEGVEKARTESFDVILMDIQMPRMGGLEAASAIRALAAKKTAFLPPKLAAGTLPIIAMTAHAMSSDRDKSLDAGMNDHITKPIDATNLYERLEYWLSR